MALVEASSILSYEQVVTETSYAQRCIDMKELGDYGVGHPYYFVVNVLGTFTKDLRVQIVGFTDDTFSDPMVLGDSGIHPKAELLEGESFAVQLNQVDRKYRFISLRYIPSDAGSETTEVSGSDVVDTTNFAPPQKVGEVRPAVPNGLTAFGALTIPTKLLYKYVNSDKATI